jgi:hypothetical protein
MKVSWFEATTEGGTRADQPGLTITPGRLTMPTLRAGVFKFIKWFLLIWGGLSLAIALVLGAIILYQLGLPNRGKDDSASPHDVRFVLNWCRLGDQRIVQVVHSHVSAPSFTPDHLNAFAIKISHVDESDFTPKTDDPTGRWYRGDQLPPVLDAAVKFVTGWHQEIPWFPSEAELRSSEFYVYPWSIYYHGVDPNAAELIFVRKSDKMVFYFDGEM